MADLERIGKLVPRLKATRRRLAGLALVRHFGFAAVAVFTTLFVALTGVLDRVDPSQAAVAILVLVAITAGLAYLGWRSFVWPTESEARIAFDRQSELRPVASLTDRPAAPSVPGQTLWHAHTERLAREAAALQPPAFKPEWQQTDPYRLRLVLPALLLALVLLAGNDAWGRLQRAFSPDIGSLLGAKSLRVDAWITPPQYTSRAPIFLTADAPRVETPTGSEATIRVKARSAPTLVLTSLNGDRQKIKFEKTPDGVYEIKAAIEASAEMSVRWWGERAAWTVSTLPDTPPVPSFDKTPEVTKKDKLAFEWSVSDDYGVEDVALVFARIDPHPAAPDETASETIQLPGLSPRELTKEGAELDLTRHKWAGLEVNAYLEATDASGLVGRSETVVITIPEKLLLQPLAKATQEIRVTVLRDPQDYRDGVLAKPEKTRLPDGSWLMAESDLNRLEFAPEGVRQGAYMVDAVTYQPRIFFKNYSLYLGLEAAKSILETATSKAEADTVDSLLWAVALQAEYGSAADALAALLAARRALEQALREGASEDEIARLTEAFRNAAERYVQAKLAEAVANGLPEGQQPNQDGAGGAGGPNFGNNSFQDMLNALEDLTETGGSDQARQLLSDITNLLENLEFQQGGQGQGNDGFTLPGQQGGDAQEDERTDEERELAEDLDDLSEALRDQRELNDDTLDAERNGGGAAGGEFDPEALAQRQDEIAEALRQLAERAEQNGQTGGEPGEEGGAPRPGGEEGEERRGPGGLDDRALAEALTNQGRAERALRNGQFGRAQRFQQRATEALADQAAELARQLDEAERARTGDEGEGRAETDPLGREQIGERGFGTGDVSVPDEDDRQRAKDILEELRRRFGETEDSDERDYLERLLDRF